MGSVLDKCAGRVQEGFMNLTGTTPAAYLERVWYAAGVAGRPLGRNGALLNIVFALHATGLTDAMEKSTPLRQFMLGAQLDRGAWHSGMEPWSMSWVRVAENLTPEAAEFVGHFFAAAASRTAQPDLFGVWRNAKSMWESSFVREELKKLAPGDLGIATMFINTAKWVDPSETLMARALQYRAGEIEQDERAKMEALKLHEQAQNQVQERLARELQDLAADTYGDW